LEDEIRLTADAQRLVGLINRMRLFAPENVITEADAVIKALIEIALKPGVELRRLAVEALSKSPDPDSLRNFSIVCQADLDNVRRSLV
jgi:HEAT repeat protein